MTDISIWAYPWDLHDIGLDQAIARIRDAGAKETIRRRDKGGLGDCAG